MTMRTRAPSVGAVARGLVVLVAALAVWGAGIGPAAAAPAPLNGSGSTYVALAMQQWVADAQTSGLRVNYQPVGSPAGLEGFNSGLTDFAGTEAEFRSIGIDPSRGYQYVPDVAGAVAVMYNAKDTAGRKIDYLNLSRRTIARIFIGDITTWSDPAIAADNDNKVRLPDEPITVLFRSGRSGTTALFYDFVANTVPDLFNAWAARNGFNPAVRIVELGSGPSENFVPNKQGLGDSDLIARTTKQKEWTISYDEFGYAKVYDVPVSWVDNNSGQWTKPYARNISAALESAGLRPDLTQELSKVYASGDPEAYPISAYSYIVTQCAPTGDRPTCKGQYSDGGKAETFATWLRYIACEGQVNMARIGYSPLPPNLSQEMANSIARITGQPAEQLNAGNCANPRFSGNLPAAPEVNRVRGGDVPATGNDPAAAGKTTTTKAGAAGSGPGGGPGVTTPEGGTVVTTTVVASSDDEESAADIRTAAPIAYERPGTPTASSWPLVALLLIIIVPVAVGLGRRFTRRSS